MTDQFDTCECGTEPAVGDDSEGIRLGRLCMADLNRETERR